MKFADIGVAGGHGRVKQQTQFQIRDQVGFGRFAQCEFFRAIGRGSKFVLIFLRGWVVLITQPAFTWRLKSRNVKATAFGFLPVHGLTFIKVRTTVSE